MTSSRSHQAADPPVCRLMDYGKFRYEATRREREARKAQRSKTTNELREVRLEGRIGDHDLETKIRQVKRLLGEGSKVRVSVRFRGREITHPEIGMALLRRVAESLVEDAGMEKAPSFEGPVPSDDLGARDDKRQGFQAKRRTITAD